MPKINNSFVVSRWLAVGANVLNIVSSWFFSQIARGVMGSANLVGNSAGIYVNKLRKKYAGVEINQNPTLEEAKQPIIKEDIEKWLGTSLTARNWAAHSPRVIAAISGMVSGQLYGRTEEIITGFSFACINALPLLKFDEAYKYSGRAGLALGVVIFESGVHHKDPFQVGAGLLIFLHFAVHAKVDNKFEADKVDGLFVAKLKDRWQQIKDDNIVI